MIQGCSLLKAFADLLGVESEPTVSSQIAGYVCLSISKELEGFILLQPFSPFLFRMGQLDGPDRLLRKLRGEIIMDQCDAAWWEVASKKPKRAKTHAQEPTFKCLSCYMQKKQIFDHPGAKYAAKSRHEWQNKILSHGAWRRCMDCMSQTTAVEAKADESRDGDAAIACAGCSSLRSDWSAQERQDNRNDATPLLSQDCRKLGKTPRDMDLYVCIVCNERKGTTKFTWTNLHTEQEKSCGRGPPVQRLYEEVAM